MLDQECKNEKSISKMHKRKSSHHFQVDYVGVIPEDDDKENVKENQNMQIVNSYEVRKKRKELQFQQLENSVRMHCEYCKRSISQQNMIFCMMDRCFCSEYCRQHMFSQPLR